MFVLLIYLYAAGVSGGNAISMQEFTTAERCETARQWMLKSQNKAYGYILTECVPK